MGKCVLFPELHRAGLAAPYLRQRKQRRETEVDGGAETNSQQAPSCFLLAEYTSDLDWCYRHLYAVCLVYI